MFRKRKSEEPAGGSTQSLGEYLEVLRGKWEEVPAGRSRLKTSSLLRLEDKELVETWRRACAEASEHREWYHTLYSPSLKDRSVLDVGSGFGIDGLQFALKGAHITFLDIVESNLEVLRRLSQILGVRDASFCYLRDERSLEALPSFDFLWCQGSMINEPFELAKVESRHLLKHLKPAGRWVELAYPKARWEREGRLPFDRWGKKTDGWAPWIEWYDLEKLQRRLAPARFKTILDFEFHDHEFIWFDLAREESK